MSISNAKMDRCCILEQYLLDNNIMYDLHNMSNSGFHYIVKPKHKPDIHVWPTTNKYWIPETQRKGYLDYDNLYLRLN